MYIYVRLGQYLKKDGTKGFCGTPALKSTQWNAKLAMICFKKRLRFKRVRVSPIGSSARPWPKGISDRTGTVAGETCQRYQFAEPTIAMPPSEATARL